MPGTRLSPFALLLFVVLCPPTAVAAQTAEMEQGKRLYESQCGSCHGPLGNGGKGANLAQPQLRRAFDDQALFNIIRRGIRGTEMPGSPLTPSQVSSIAAYVKTLGRVGPEDVAGDGRRGAAVYAALDCARCHTLRGRGGDGSFKASRSPPSPPSATSQSAPVAAAAALAVAAVEA